MEFDVAGGALRLEIRKYISEQQSGHIQRDRGGVASVSAAVRTEERREEAETFGA